MVFWLSGARSLIRGIFLTDIDNLRLTRPRGAYIWPYRQNSKSLPAKSNSSKRGLAIRSTLTPSDRTWE
jgi:hypothetical protein